jgi:palmitoyltransferase ZDHHC13/17
VKGSRACIKRLVEAGANLESKEESGKTPRDLADELKALEPWVAGLKDAGMDEGGRRIGKMMGEVGPIRRKRREWKMENGSEWDVIY